MDLKQLGPGANPPEELNAIIEIPAHSAPVKYELEKQHGLLFVDRFLSTTMVYPANYGLIPATLCDDGDPLDVLVVTPLPLIHGCLIRVRPVDMLYMTDEHGEDAKIVAVPVSAVYPGYDKAQSVDDLPVGFKDQVAHFFSQYKAFEPGKWAEIKGWGGRENALAEVRKSIALYLGKAG